MMNDLGSTHEHTAPGTPQWNRVAERALGLLKERNVAMLEKMSEGGTHKLWAAAMSISGDPGNACVTTANMDGTPAYEKWHGKPFNLSGIPPFGTVWHL